MAAQAEVSVATVSRALAGDPQISEATQARVRQVAERLGYVPNIAARALVRPGQRVARGQRGEQVGPAELAEEVVPS